MRIMGTIKYRLTACINLAQTSSFPLYELEHILDYMIFKVFFSLIFRHSTKAWVFQSWAVNYAYMNGCSTLYVHAAEKVYS